MNIFLAVFVLGAIISGITAIILIATTSSAGGFEGAAGPQPVRQSWGRNRK